jgi:nucleoid-associated protein YgaU
LVERIQRWRLRQSGGAPMETEQRAVPEVPYAGYSEPAAVEASAESAEEQISELDVEPDAVAPEEATAEVDPEEIEEVG